MQSRTQPISQRTRSRRILTQQSESNGVLHITLRSSVRGLAGLIITIPTWDVGDDENISDASSDETISSGSATITTISESEDEELPVPPCLAKIPIHVIKQSDIFCGDCAICLEPFKLRQHAKKLRCEHMFHKKCIDKWLNRSQLCPCCRDDMNTSMESVPVHRNLTRFRLRPRG
jgi:hypothetical protein